MLKISGQIKGVLGKGNFWTTKEIEIDSPITIEGIKYKNLVCKFSNKKFRYNIGKNLKNYHNIKRAGLPTLLFLKYGVFEGEECLVTENLNNRPDTLYVSPNTSTEKPNPIFIALSNRTYDYIPSINEKYLSEHKIQELVEFETFLNHLKGIVNDATLGKLGLCADACFFGVNKRTFSQLVDCIIGDFDNILKDDDDEEDFENLFKQNMGETTTALYEFVQKFVVEDKQQKYLNNILSWSNDNQISNI